MTQQVRVPTALERNGDFSQTFNADGTRPTIYHAGHAGIGESAAASPNNIIPPNLINPLGQAIMNIFPLPNFQNDTTNNYLNQYAQEDKRHLTVGKVDWNINDIDARLRSVQLRLSALPRPGDLRGERDAAVHGDGLESSRTRR